MKIHPDNLFTQCSFPTYNPYEKADKFKSEIHRKSHLVRKISKAMQDASIPRCPCCGFPTKAESFSLNCKILELSELGAGFSLYFILTKQIGLLLLIGFVVVSIPCMIDNILSQDSHEWNHKESSWEIVSTLANKGKDGVIYPLWQCALHIGYMLFVLIYANICEKWLRRKEKEFDVNVVSPKDFTIHAYGLGMTEEDELKRFFEENGRIDGKKAIVVKVVPVYRIKKYIDSIRKVINLTKELNQFNQSRKFLCKKRRSKELIQNEIRVANDHIQNYENEEPSQLKTGQAFITFQTQDDARAVEFKFKRNLVTRIWKKIFWVFCRKQSGSSNRINDENIFAQLAHEPNDIYWENLEFSFRSRFLRMIETSLFTLITVLASFVLVYGMKIYEKDLKQKNSNESESLHLRLKLASMWPSVAIILLNFFLIISTRYSVFFERPHSLTHYNISLAFKLVFVMFFNTAIITLFINYDWKEDWFVPGGLVVDSVYILFSNSLITPIVFIFSPAFLLHWYNKRRVTLSTSISQHEANHLFENPSVDIAQKYANLIKTLLLTFCYAPLVPLAFGISLLGVILDYWSFKYLLLRKHSFPHQVSAELARSIFGLIPWALLFYSFINFIFCYFLNEIEKELSFYWMCFLVIYNLCPLQLLKKGHIKNDLACWETGEKYDEVSINFVQDYDKVNPFTASKALMTFIKNLLDLGLVNSNEFRSIEDDVLKDFPDRFKSLQRYATMRSNFGEFQPEIQKTLKSLPRSIIGIHESNSTIISQVFEKIKEKVEKQKNSTSLNMTQIADAYNWEETGIRTENKEIQVFYKFGEKLFRKNI